MDKNRFQLLRIRFVVAAHRDAARVCRFLERLARTTGQRNLKITAHQIAALRAAVMAELSPDDSLTMKVRRAG